MSNLFFALFQANFSPVLIYPEFYSHMKPVLNFIFKIHPLALIARICPARSGYDFTSQNPAFLQIRATLSD